MTHIYLYNHTRPTSTYNSHTPTTFPFTHKRSDSFLLTSHLCISLMHTRRATRAAATYGSWVRTAPWSCPRPLGATRLHEPWASTHYRSFLSCTSNYFPLPLHWGRIVPQCLSPTPVDHSSSRYNHQSAHTKHQPTTISQPPIQQQLQLPTTNQQPPKSLGAFSMRAPRYTPGRLACLRVWPCLFGPRHP